MTQPILVQSWSPPSEVGTWHPMGARTGPVRYEQRINGQPTGLFFVVSRAKHRLRVACVIACNVPIIGAAARWWLRTTKVLYQMPIVGKRGVA